MPKRDYIEEILSKKSRLAPVSRRWGKLSERIKRITSVVELLDFLEPTEELTQFLEEYEDIKSDLSKISDNYLDIRYEMSRYVPIGFVACIEGYFRLAYADLINYGKPYRDNVSKFDIKFSLETALALESHSVSMGEFVAHLLPTSSLDDINKNMSTIIGEDFLQRLRKVVPMFEKQHYPMPLIPVDDEEVFDAVISRVRKFFELRHMFAHEIDPHFEREDSDRMWYGSNAVVEFLWASEEIINDLLHRYIVTNPSRNH